MKEITTRYQGYCEDCQFTVWIGEIVKYDGAVHHLDCRRALQDPTPRVLNPNYISLYGNVDKKRIAKALDNTPRRASKNYKHRANRGVSFWSG